MTRLLCFLAFWPSSYAMILAAGTDQAERVLPYYLGAFVLGYVGGKGVDGLVQAATVKAENAGPTQAPGVAITAKNANVQSKKDPLE